MHKCKDMLSAKVVPSFVPARKTPPHETKGAAGVLGEPMQVVPNSVSSFDKWVEPPFDWFRPKVAGRHFVGVGQLWHRPSISHGLLGRAFRWHAPGRASHGDLRGMGSNKIASRGVSGFDKFVRTILVVKNKFGLSFLPIHSGSEYN